MQPTREQEHRCVIKCSRAQLPSQLKRRLSKNIVSSGDEDETEKSSSNDSAEKSYASPEKGHTQLPYEREEDFSENIGTLSIQQIPLLSLKTTHQKKFRSLTYKSESFSQ